MEKTLKELLEERKKIDEKIRELRQQNIVVDNTMFMYQHFRYWDEQQIRIKASGRGAKRWCTVINYDKKEDVLKELARLIESLKKLLNMLEEETNDGTNKTV